VYTSFLLFAPSLFILLNHIILIQSQIITSVEPNLGTHVGAHFGTHLVTNPQAHTQSNS
jgi:hypothetical protein